MLKDTIEAIDINFKRASADYNEIASWDELTPIIFENDGKRRILDSFIFRFMKIQDLMGEKLFKEVLGMVGEYKRSMSLTDVLDKAEKLEIINSADEWNNFRNLRNNLTHEYPSNIDEIVKDIKLAMVYFHKILDVYKNIKNYINKKETS